MKKASQVCEWDLAVVCMSLLDVQRAVALYIFPG